MKRTLRIIVLAFAAAIFNSSCSEKIDLKLKNSEPQIVIEGRLSDQPGPYSVVISKSRLYYENNQFETLPGALVVISDDAGNIDTLAEVAPGFHQTNLIQGVVGRTYKLSVTVEGTTYVSLCKMQPPVDIDSIIFSTETEFDGTVKNRAQMIVNDPPGVQNFYRLFSPKDGYYDLHRDRLWDGKTRYFNVPHKDFLGGDTLEIELWSIDESVYNFFSTFNQNQNNFGAPAAPANPDPVFTPAALGYFSAHSVKSKTVIIP